MFLYMLDQYPAAFGFLFLQIVRYYEVKLIGMSETASGRFSSKMVRIETTKSLINNSGRAYFLVKLVVVCLQIY